jgi:hypothetical protein
MEIPSLHLLSINASQKRDRDDGASALLVCHGNKHGKVHKWEDADTLDVDPSVRPTFTYNISLSKGGPNGESIDQVVTEKYDRVMLKACNANAFFEFKVNGVREPLSTDGFPLEGVVEFIPRETAWTNVSKLLSDNGSLYVVYFDELFGSYDYRSGNDEGGLCGIVNEACGTNFEEEDSYVEHVRGEKVEVVVWKKVAPAVLKLPPGNGGLATSRRFTVAMGGGSFAFYAIPASVFYPEEDGFYVAYSDAVINVDTSAEEEESPIRMRVLPDNVTIVDWYPHYIRATSKMPKVGGVFLNAIVCLVAHMRSLGMTNADYVELNDLSQKKGFPIRSLKQIFEKKLGYYEQFGFKGDSDEDKIRRMRELHELEPKSLSALLNLREPLTSTWKQDLEEYLRSDSEDSRAYPRWAVVVFSWFKYVEGVDIDIVQSGSHYDENDIAEHLLLNYRLPSDAVRGCDNVQVDDVQLDDIDKFAGALVGARAPNKGRASLVCQQ